MESDCDEISNQSNDDVEDLINDDVFNKNQFVRRIKNNDKQNNNKNRPNFKIGKTQQAVRVLEEKAIVQRLTLLNKNSEDMEISLSLIDNQFVRKPKNDGKKLCKKHKNEDKQNNNKNRPNFKIGKTQQAVRVLEEKAIVQRLTLLNKNSEDMEISLSLIKTCDIQFLIP